MIRALSQAIPSNRDRMNVTHSQCVAVCVHDRIDCGCAFPFARLSFTLTCSRLLDWLSVHRALNVHCYWPLSTTDQCKDVRSLESHFSIGRTCLPSELFTMRICVTELSVWMPSWKAMLLDCLCQCASVVNSSQSNGTVQPTACECVSDSQPIDRSTARVHSSLLLHNYR